MHADISPDDLSSLSHEILQILPRSLDGKLSSALYGALYGERDENTHVTDE